MSNATITGRITPEMQISGKVGCGRTIRGTFATPKRYAGSPLTTSSVYHKNIIRTLGVPAVGTSATIEVG